MPPEIREEITPKNILMKGPTGVGKTEIARRLAKLVNAPFIKVEATKFTEVGYVGRDCESMIRDLVEVSVQLVKEEKIKKVQSRVEKIVNQKIFNEIYPVKKQENANVEEEKTRILNALANGEYDNDYVEMEVSTPQKNVEIMATAGSEINLGSIFGEMFPNKKKKRKLTIKEAKQLLAQEESEKLIDLDGVNAEAISRAENEGIIFIDEIDKITGSSGGKGPDVSREGVQRDILPFVEGCTVQTKYGMVRTDFMLFIGAGAFHIAKMEDLIPELQGRFPVRVELDNLTKDDFLKILTVPKNAIIKQYESLLSIDNIKLKFTDDALEEIAVLTEKENETSENIGARRLHSIMEKILEDISYNASQEIPETEVIINKEYIDRIFSNSIKNYDLTKYIL